MIIIFPLTLPASCLCNFQLHSLLFFYYYYFVIFFSFLNWTVICLTRFCLSSLLTTLSSYEDNKPFIK